MKRGKPTGVAGASASRTIWVTILALWMSTAALALLSCDSGVDGESAAGVDVAKRRAEGYREQIARAEEQRQRWQPWYVDLARQERRDRCPAAWTSAPTGETPPSAADGLCVREGSQRLMWDPELSRALSDSASLHKEPCKGPLCTIVAFQRQLRALDVDLLVLIVPPVSAVYPESIGLPTPLAAGEDPPLLDRHLRAFYLALEDAGVEVVDLLPEYLRRRHQGEMVEEPGGGARRELLYHRQDPHWTSFGAAVAAEVLAERIRRFPWYESEARRMGEAMIEETFPIEHRRGSIVRRLQQRGGLPADLPSEVVRRRQVKIQGEIWSLTDTTSPIVLIGDSFSSPSFDLSNQLLRQLTWRVDTVTVTGGFPTGGVKALRFRGDRLAGKRLVIWEITSYALWGQTDWRPVDLLASASTDP